MLLSSSLVEAMSAAGLEGGPGGSGGKNRCRCSSPSNLV